MDKCYSCKNLFPGMGDTLECYVFDCLNHNKYEEREKTDPEYDNVMGIAEAMERGKKHERYRN